MLCVKLTIILIFVEGCRAPACVDPPTAVWPLGTGDNCTEIIGGTNSGTMGNVAYGSGIATIDMNSAMQFSGGSDSYVELAVPSSMSDSNGDYSMRFYINFDSISSGTVFHYRSDSFNGSATDGIITEIEVYVLNGNIRIEYTGYGSVSFLTNAVVGEWYNVIIERDETKTGSKLYFDALAQELSPSNSISGIETIFPGTLKIGGNFNGDNPLSGRVACFQFVPCKTPTDAIYDQYCETQMTTTSTTTSTTEKPTTTTTTTAQPTTTTTTKQTTTTTTTEQPTTTTTTEQPTTATVQPSSFSKAVSYSLTTGVCYHFTLTGTHVTFRFLSDIIDISLVSDTVSCMDICKKQPSCSSFIVTSKGSGVYECRIGPQSPLTSAHTGSMLYEL